MYLKLLLPFLCVIFCLRSDAFGIPVGQLQTDDAQDLAVFLVRHGPPGPQPLYRVLCDTDDVLLRQIVRTPEPHHLVYAPPGALGRSPGGQGTVLHLQERHQAPVLLGPAVVQAGSEPVPHIAELLFLQIGLVIIAVETVMGTSAGTVPEQGVVATFLPTQQAEPLAVHDPPELVLLLQVGDADEVPAVAAGELRDLQGFHGDLLRAFILFEFDHAAPK